MNEFLEKLTVNRKSYSGAAACVKETYTAEGFRGLWRGGLLTSFWSSFYYTIVKKTGSHQCALHASYKGLPKNLRCASPVVMVLLTRGHATTFDISYTYILGKKADHPALYSRLGSYRQHHCNANNLVHHLSESQVQLLRCYWSSHRR